MRRVMKYRFNDLFVSTGGLRCYQVHSALLTAIQRALPILDRTSLARNKSRGKTRVDKALG